jgi:hypothetical protein
MNWFSSINRSIWFRSKSLVNRLWVQFLLLSVKLRSLKNAKKPFLNSFENCEIKSKKFTAENKTSLMIWLKLRIEFFQFLLFVFCNLFYLFSCRNSRLLEKTCLQLLLCWAVNFESIGLRTKVVVLSQLSHFQMNNCIIYKFYYNLARQYSVTT